MDKKRKKDRSATPTYGRKYTTRVILKKRKKKKRSLKTMKRYKKDNEKHGENIVTNPLEFELPNLSQGF